MSPSNSPAALQQNSLTRYKVLLGAIIVQLILGTVYGYSIFWTPLAAEIFPPVITAAQKIQMDSEGKDTSGY